MRDSCSERTDTWESFNVAIRSYIDETKSLDRFDQREFEEIILSKNVLRKAEKKQKMADNKSATDDALHRKVLHRPVNMVDLEMALFHMFRREIPQRAVIRGETYDALVQWLTVLVKVRLRGQHVDQ